MPPLSLAVAATSPLAEPLARGSDSPPQSPPAFESPCASYSARAAAATRLEGCRLPSTRRFRLGLGSRHSVGLSDMPKSELLQKKSSIISAGRATALRVRERLQDARKADKRALGAPQESVKQRRDACLKACSRPAASASFTTSTAVHCLHKHLCRLKGRIALTYLLHISHMSQMPTAVKYATTRSGGFELKGTFPETPEELSRSLADR